MNETDLCYAGATAQAGHVHSGEVSATELVQATLDRIGEVNPKINALRCVFAEDALTTAHAIDAQPKPSRRSHPLLGVPVAIKDNVDVAGAVTTAGSAGFETPAERDDPLVESLRQAGAIVIGKATCSELTVWPFTENETWGITRNPWNTNFSSGGSSGGSGAAVAAGLCGIATGSDGLGSIRVPAGFNGVFGIKPNRGRVHHSGGAWNGLSCNGPLSRSVADAAAFLDATAIDRQGPDGPVESFAAALDESPRPLRIALVWKPLVDYPFVARLGDDERAAVEWTAEVLRGLGHDVIEHALDFSPKASSNGMIRYLRGIAADLENVEFPDRITSRTRTMAKFGSRIPARLLESAVRDSAAIAARLNSVFDTFDVVMTPGAVERPLRIGELDGKGAMTTLRLSGKRIPHYGIWNVVGQPAASVPAGLSSQGLPVSLQLAGRPFDEVTLLQLAHQLEAAQPWNQTRPI